MDTLLPTQPTPYWPLIKRSFALYRASFTRIILLSLALSAIAFIPRLLSDIVGDDIFTHLSPFSLQRAWLLLINLAGITFFIAILWRMHCVIIDRHEPFAEDLRVGIKKLFYAFVASLLQGVVLFAILLIVYGNTLLVQEYNLLAYDHFYNILLVAIVFFVQLLLIVYIATLFIFFFPLIAIENKGIFSALEKSISLVWNHWWRVYSVQLTPWVSYLIILVLLRSIFRLNLHIYYLSTGPASHSFWLSLVHLVIFAIFIPWVAATMLVQLKDLELRKSHTNE